MPKRRRANPRQTPDDADANSQSDKRLPDQDPTKRENEAGEGDRAVGCVSRRFKMVVSTLLMFHLAAVVLPPLAFQTLGSEGPSPLVGTLIRPFAGYGQFLHMDRGYAFFAPNPGPSHLIQAAFTGPDGTITERMYPDLDDQWPRLLYHRHFMLTEYLNEIYYPPMPSVELLESAEADAQDWRRRRERYEYVRQSMVGHLKTVNAGRAVAIRRIEHGLPGLQDYREEPIDLTDPRLYSVLLDRAVIPDDFNPESTEEIPASGGVEESKSLPLPGSSNALPDDASPGGAAEAAESAVETGAVKPETRS